MFQFFKSPSSSSATTSLRLILPALQLTCLGYMLQCGPQRSLSEKTLCDASHSVGTTHSSSSSHPHKNHDAQLKQHYRIFHTSDKPEVIPPQVLLYKNDRYDGVIVDTKGLPEAEGEFAARLADSIAHWKKLHRRGVWLKIPIQRAHLIASAIEQGFVFHHAERDYVMLNHWLSEAEENKLPPNASHQVGVGCVVLKDGKLLLVQEKNGPLKNTGIWKLPTGLVDHAEDLCDAAIREVSNVTLV